MALTDRQTKAILNLYIKNIIEVESKEEREKLYWELEEYFKGSISNFEKTVYMTLCENDVSSYIVSEWEAYQKKDISSINEFTICDMTLEDEDAIVKILLEEIGCRPALSECNEIGSVKDFKDTGFSFVAKKEKKVIGVMMAQKIMDYGSNYIFINNYAVSSSYRGIGVGRMLMDHLIKLGRQEDICRICLYTKKGLKAYDIYHHMGFQDQADNSVYLTKWFV